MGPAANSSCAERGCLYVVATPIGNLKDLSPRAVSILTDSDVIACENTRKARRLLDPLGITTRVMLCNEHNEKRQANAIADMVASGKSVALISEAGTPCISDPGFRVVRECRRRDLPVASVPGPSAGLAALAASGLPSNGFLFVGFLPAKKSARRRFFEKYRNFEYTLVFYESTHRIDAFLDDIVDILGPQRTICLAREMTKIYETFLVGPADEVRKRLKAGSKKGEFVVLAAKDGYLL